MNSAREFRELLPAEKRYWVEIMQVRADGTSVVQTPDGRILRARGTGIPVGSKAFVVVSSRPNQQPRLDGPAPDLPLSIFSNL